MFDRTFLAEQVQVTDFVDAYCRRLIFQARSYPAHLPPTAGCNRTELTLDPGGLLCEESCELVGCDIGATNRRGKVKISYLDLSTEQAD